MSQKRVDGTLEHKLFWLVLAAAVVLPLFGVFTGMFSVEMVPTTGKAIQTVAYEPAGSRLHFEVRNIEGMKELTITFLEDAKNMVINFEEINALSWKFEGTIYSQFRISSADAKKIGRTKVVLKIKEADLKELGLFKDEVKLYLAGQELETKLTKSEDEYIFYEANGEGIGEFVIGKAKKTAVEEVVGIVAEEPEKIAEPVREEPRPAEKDLISKVVSFFKKLFN